MDQIKRKKFQIIWKTFWNNFSGSEDPNLSRGVAGRGRQGPGSWEEHWNQSIYAAKMSHGEIIPWWKLNARIFHRRNFLRQIFSQWNLPAVKFPGSDAVNLPLSEITRRRKCRAAKLQLSLWSFAQRNFRRRKLPSGPAELEYKETAPEG